MAIELAAARTSVLSVTEIAERLDHRFSILTSFHRASAPRQQTLRALIEWSYDLLPENEKQAFRSLGVFSGNFSLDSAAAVQKQDAGEAAFDVLASLVEKSLVHAEAIDGKTRFRMLESVRAYAHEQLTEHGELSRGGPGARAGIPRPGRAAGIAVGRYAGRRVEGKRGAGAGELACRVEVGLRPWRRPQRWPATDRGAAPGLVHAGAGRGARLGTCGARRMRRFATGSHSSVARALGGAPCDGGATIRRCVSVGAAGFG